MYIVSFSGGKDSTAMLLKMIENKDPIHSVLFFDTDWDFPEILNHIEQLKQDFPYIHFQKVRHWAGFDFLEKWYGKPDKSGGWCSAAKRDTCNKYIRLIKKYNPDIVECIGFSADESHRANKINKKWPVRFPLIEWNITEKQALEICHENGYYFGGIYEWMPSKRVSCIKCPKQSKNDWEEIKKRGYI
jgi:3'-phosphoadenosine 5'-phosphosulfate sulfotransferase (PAPS reductase)/FAD synthetase